MVSNGIVIIDDYDWFSTGAKDADCVASLSKEDFHGMLTGTVDPMGAFMGGRIKIDGDMGVAMKLPALFG